MTVDVLIFGPAAAAANTDRAPVSVREPATVRDVLTAIAAQHPGLAFALDGARLAVNQSLASPDTPVQPGDELALISLLGGG